MSDIRPVELFISHISEEQDLASLLKTSLEADFGPALKVFASSDITSIQAGADWLPAIYHAMDRAAVVLVLCSVASVKRPWVQFEIGAAWMRRVPIVPVCHSDMTADALPMPLSLKQGIEIGQANGLKRLHLAIADVCGPDAPPLPSANDLAARLANVQALEQQYRGRLQQFERCFDIVLPPPGRLDGAPIPMEAEVRADAYMLDVFGYLPGARRTWKDVVRAAARTPDTRWIGQLERCVQQASRDEQFEPVQAIYHADRRSYQPQLAKKEMREDGSWCFHVHMVETVVAPLAEVDNEFGLLATLLRLGLRFRYEVIERYPRLKRMRDAGGDRLAPADIRRQLQEAIRVIENDALSRGAQNFDPVAVTALFGDEDDQQAMDTIQGDWEAARRRLFARDGELDEAAQDAVVAAMRDLNVRFMTMGTRRFHEMVAERWAA